MNAASTKIGDEDQFISHQYFFTKWTVFAPNDKKKDNRLFFSSYKLVNDSTHEACLAYSWGGNLEEFSTGSTANSL